MSRSERPLSAGVKLFRAEVEIRNLKASNAAYAKSVAKLRKQAKYWRDAARSLGARSQSTRNWKRGDK